MKKMRNTQNKVHKTFLIRNIYKSYQCARTTWNELFKTEQIYHNKQKLCETNKSQMEPRCRLEKNVTLYKN